MRCVICEQEHSAEEPCAPTAKRAGSNSRLSDVLGMTARTHLSPVPQPLPQGDPDEALVGTTVGSFKITRVIGRGGMGTVFMGEQAIIGSKVAIKFLHEHLSSNAALVQRFYAEARAVNLIGHANIVNIFDMNVLPSGRYYLVMEYLEGQSLAEKAMPMRPEVAIPVLVQVCDALDAAHKVNIVHRDLKPENIVLVKRGREDNFVKILDFGIAKLFGASDPGREQTAAGMIIGTPEYMAPEQASSSPVDGRCDIYSLGIIAYQLATGRTPFGGANIPAILVAHIKEVPPAPHIVNPSVPKAWSLAIMKALEKKPESRFATAEAFGRALEEALAPAVGSLRARVFAPEPVPPPPGAPGSSPSASRPAPPPVAPSSSSAGEPVAPPASAPVRVDAPAMSSSPSKGTPARTDRLSTPIAPTPTPAWPRHEAKFNAEVIGADGKSLGSLPCQDISRGGLFLCSETLWPPIFTRVSVKLPGVNLVQAEVVRHVTPEQAKAWNMSPGFGLQFIALNAQQKEVIDKLMKGLPLSSPTPAPPNVSDDPIARKVLEAWARRINGDHYVVLALHDDADFADIRARGRELKRELEGLKARPLSDAQLAMVDSSLKRVQAALDVVGHAAARLEFDGHRGNFRGVAKCIAAGLTVTEIERIREKFLAAHPGAEGAAQIHFISGNAFEKANELPQALSSFEQALKLDPMNLTIQQRYWALRRKMGQ
jgi:serine/threonine-protein kinase